MLADLPERKTVVQAHFIVGHLNLNCLVDTGATLPPGFRVNDADPRTAQTVALDAEDGARIRLQWNVADDGTNVSRLRFQAVVQYLDSQPQVQTLLAEYEEFIRARIGEYRGVRRRYITLGIGCTGGQHRSVYLVNRLTERLASQAPGIISRHSALAKRTS
jgi:hypothetical protein